MTEAERQTLRYFSADERLLSGAFVDWAAFDYQTMYWMDMLRHHLGSSIYLIRGAHPNKPTAVDATCPGIPLAQVVMALTRLPGLSWGVYSGNSFHLDRREYEDLPARWMAIKPAERSSLIQAGLDEVIATDTTTDAWYDLDWLYLSWSHPRAFDALSIVCELSESRRVA